MQVDKTSLDYLAQIAKGIKVVRDQISTYVNAQHEAESEIPEKLRRFVTYWHALHDIINIYEEKGHLAPPNVKREMERCDDRFRQLLEEAHIDGLYLLERIPSQKIALWQRFTPALKNTSNKSF